jgi:Domain of unknown function (DUF4282)
MTDRSLSQGWPDDWNGGRYAAREAQPGVDPFGPFGVATANQYGTADPRTARLDISRLDPGRTAAVERSTASEAADKTGFLGALFDFGFSSFMTPRIIRVLYVLLMIGTVVSALAFTIIVFKVSAAFGIVTLLFGDPLVILIVMAIYRIILEFFVVTFRLAEDIQRLRERGDLG